MSKFYFTKPDAFVKECEVSTVFMEHDKKILVLLRSKCEHSPHTWGVPGGKLEKNENPLNALFREIQEELSIDAKIQSINFLKSVYVDHSKVKYILHLFKWDLETKPPIILNPKELIRFVWQPIEKFHELNLLEGQFEAFQIVYFA